MQQEQSSSAGALWAPALGALGVAIPSHRALVLLPGRGWGWHCSRALLSAQDAEICCAEGSGGLWGPFSVVWNGKRAARAGAQLRRGSSCSNKVWMN